MLRIDGFCHRIYNQNSVRYTKFGDEWSPCYDDLDAYAASCLNPDTALMDSAYNKVIVAIKQAAGAYLHLLPALTSDQDERER